MKKICSRYIWIAIFLVSHVTNPMGMRLNRIILNNKEAIKATAIYGGAFLVGSSLSASNNEEKKIKLLPDASILEKEFAREQFKILGIKNPASIQVKIGEEYSAGKNFVTIPQGYCWRQELLAKKKYQDTEILQFQGALQHEGNHVKFNHIKKNALILNGGIIGIQFILCKTKMLSITKRLSVLGCCISTLAGIIHANRYRQEWQADNYIQDNPDLLRAMAKDFKDYYHHDYRYHSDFNKITGVHPHPLKRAQRLEERANQAESDKFSKAKLEK